MKYSLIAKQYHYCPICRLTYINCVCDLHPDCGTQYKYIDDGNKGHN